MLDDFLQGKDVKIRISEVCKEIHEVKEKKWNGAGKSRFYSLKLQKKCELRNMWLEVAFSSLKSQKWIRSFMEYTTLSRVLMPVYSTLIMQKSIREFLNTCHTVAFSWPRIFFYKFLRKFNFLKLYMVPQLLKMHVRSFFCQNNQYMHI